MSEDLEQESTEDTVKYPYRFAPGQSGNPSGRPKDAVNKKTARKIAQELGFCPITTSIEFITKDYPWLKAKYKIEEPVSITQKAKLVMWIGDKMHSSLRSESLTVIESQDTETQSSVLQIQLPQKQHRDMATMNIERAVEVCVAEDPIDSEED